MFPAELKDVDVFTTGQSRHLGLTDSDLRQAVADGTIVRLKRGWYSARQLPWPADRHQLLTRIEHRARRHTIPSHYSAAALFGLPVHRPDWTTVHLMRTQPGPAQNRDGLVIHKRVGAFDSPSVTLAVAQTALLCQVSGLMAFDAAMHSGQLDSDEWDRLPGALAGWTGLGNLAVVRRLGDGRRESPLESHAALVYDRWGMALVPQFAVPGTSYTADGVIAGTRLLIECDGDGKYSDLSAVLAEKNRENDIRALGWGMVRVTAEMLDRPRVLFARTQSALKAAGDPRATAA